MRHRDRCANALRRSFELAYARSTLLRVACVVLIATTGRSAAAQTSGDPPPSLAQPAGVLTYQAAIERAHAANPRIVAARLQRSVVRASRDVAAERLNPELRVEMAKETPKEGYTVAMPLELGAKRARRIDVADAAIRTADAALNRVIAEVDAFTGACALTQRVALNSG